LACFVLSCLALCCLFISLLCRLGKATPHYATWVDPKGLKIGTLRA
jgi:hypothetical protein